MQIYQGDCLENIRQISDESVDMVLTDPPYSSGGLHIGDRQQSTKEKYTDHDYNGAARFHSFCGDNMDQRSYTEFMRMVLLAARQKTKPGGIIACFVDWRNLPSLTDGVQAAGWVWRGIVVWDKGTSRQIPGRFRNDCEYIVWGTNGPKPVDWTPGFKALPGCFRVNSVGTKKRQHQTEKPVELLQSLLEICGPGAVVLDPFMGSGSTGVACVNMNQEFIGVELDPGYFETAKNRIYKAKNEIHNR